jgi:hypothetical protein
MQGKTDIIGRSCTSSSAPIAHVMCSGAHTELVYNQITVIHWGSTPRTRDPPSLKPGLRPYVTIYLYIYNQRGWLPIAVHWRNGWAGSPHITVYQISTYQIRYLVCSRPFVARQLLRAGFENVNSRAHALISSGRRSIRWWYMGVSTDTSCTRHDVRYSIHRRMWLIDPILQERGIEGRRGEERITRRSLGWRIAIIMPLTGERNIINTMHNKE